MRAHCAPALFLTAALIAACSRADRADIDTAAGNVAGRIDSAVTATRQEYTDAELLGLINLFNTTQVELATVAATKATDSQVKAFAERAANDYKPLRADVDALAQTLTLMMKVPGNDESLAEAHRKATSDLAAKPKGKEYDEAYLEHEISMHKKILDEVNDALGRNPNADLRGLLGKVRTRLQANLTSAQELEKKFGV
jgi:putative membrane protein